MLGDDFLIIYGDETSIRAAVSLRMDENYRIDVAADILPGDDFPVIFGNGNYEDRHSKTKTHLPPSKHIVLTPMSLGLYHFHEQNGYFFVPWRGATEMFPFPAVFLISGAVQQRCFAGVRCTSRA